MIQESKHRSGETIPPSDRALLEKSEPSDVVAGPCFPSWLMLLFLGLALLVAVGVRVRLLEFPLERDEGEYAYAGQLMLEGIPPYQLAYNMKMPGIYLAYAGLMALFGQTPTGIHLGLLVVHLATLAVLFLLARKLLDLPGAAVATAACALMTLSPAYLGLAAHATHFLMLPALSGVWMLFRVERHGRVLDCLVCGLLFGLTFLIKQPGLFFGIFGGLWLAWVSVAGKLAAHRVLLRLGAYALGCLAPFFGVCLWLKIAGVFPEFWFWTVSYAHEYVTVLSFHEGLARAKPVLATIFQAAPLLWILAGMGLGCLCLTPMAGNRRIFLGGILLFSVLTVLPGLYFRPHYFIMLVPAVALMAGLGVSCSGGWLAKRHFRPGLARLPFLLGAVACAQSVWADRAVLFSCRPTKPAGWFMATIPSPNRAIFPAILIKTRAVTSALSSSVPSRRFISSRAGIPRPAIFTRTRLWSRRPSPTKCRRT